MHQREGYPQEHTIADWLTWQRDPMQLRIQAEALSCHFEPRHWSLVPLANAGPDRILLLQSGQAGIGLAEAESDGNGRSEYSRRAIAPALAWIPAGSAERLVLDAGGSGALLHIRRDVVTQTLRQMPEATALTPLLAASRPLVLDISEVDLAILIQNHAALDDELRLSRSGSETVVVSLLAISFVYLLRQISPGTAFDELGGEPAAILKRFRQLVEAHFRDAWPIARYAHTLGCTPDRLHAICTRTLGRAPSVLVRQRILYESVTLLERSEVTVKQLAFLLGFSDTSYFNRFFAHHIGVPPARYRREHNRRRSSHAAAHSTFSFADWP